MCEVSCEVMWEVVRDVLRCTIQHDLRTRCTTRQPLVVIPLLTLLTNFKDVMCSYIYGHFSNVTDITR